MLQCQVQTVKLIEEIAKTTEELWTCSLNWTSIDICDCDLPRPVDQTLQDEYVKGCNFI